MIDASSEVEIVTSRTGKPILRLNGKYLASAVDPEKEALTWANRQLSEILDRDHLVLFGLASGYHTLAMAKLRPDLAITVFEPDQEVFKYVNQIQSFPAQVKVYRVSERSDFDRLPVHDFLFAKMAALVTPNAFTKPELFEEILLFIGGRHKAFRHIYESHCPELSRYMDADSEPDSPLSIYDINHQVQMRKNTALNDDERVWLLLRELVV